MALAPFKKADKTPALRIARAVLLALATLLAFGGLPGARLELVPVLWRLPKEQTGARLLVETVDEQDGPMSGVHITVFAPSGDRFFAVGEGETSERGALRLPALPEGAVWVLASREGFARASTQIVLSTEERALRMALLPEHQLAVRVEGDRGEIPVELEVTSKDPLPRGGLVGADGHTVIRRLPEGPWTLRARAPGYEEVILRNVRDQEVTIHLRKLGALLVKVVDEKGEPAPLAKLIVEGTSLFPPRTAYVNERGETTITGLSSGAYTLRAVLGDKLSAVELSTLLTRGETREVTLVLAHGRWVSVEVVEEDGEAPIANADVTLAEDGLAPFPVEGRTDTRGATRLGPVGHGPASISASAKGYVSKLARADTDQVRVLLSKGGTIVGRVTDTRGRPVDGATIELVGTDREGLPVLDSPGRHQFRASHFERMLGGPAPFVSRGELGVMPGPVPPIPHGPFLTATPSKPHERSGPDAAPWVTSRDGTYRATPATPGRIRAVARHPEFVEAMSELVTLSPSGEATCDIVMQSGGALEGRVVDAHDRPVSGARVVLVATHGTLERSTQTGSDGSFAFASVPADVTLSAAPPDDPLHAAVRMDLSIHEGGRQSIVLRLPEARPPLPVRVTDGRGIGLGNVQISAMSLEHDVPLRTTTFTSERGDAELPRAKGILLRLQLFLPGYANKEVTAGPEEERVTVLLFTGETVSGEVRSSRGQPLEGAEVTLYAASGARHARTRKDGSYTVSDLSPGKARVRVRKAGFAETTREVSVIELRGIRPVNLPRLELVPEGIVEGVVVDEAGKPVPFARVAKDHVPTYVALGSTPQGVSVADAKGRFALRELPPGEVTLEAYAPDVGQGRAVGLTVAPDRTLRNVRIVLVPLAEKTPEPASQGGVAITLGESSSTREVVCVAVAEGSLAERGGLIPGDVLVEVDKKPVHTIEEARRALSGPESMDVLVKVHRGEQDEVHLLRIQRERVRK